MAGRLYNAGEVLKQGNFVEQKPFKPLICKYGPQKLTNEQALAFPIPPPWRAVTPPPATQPSKGNMLMPTEGNGEKGTINIKFSEVEMFLP